MKCRCPWCGGDSLSIAYHDHEWGVPCRDDRHLFEMLVLEGAQAGLSWRTILERRTQYRAAFAQFDVARVAAYTAARLPAPPRRPRHRPQPPEDPVRRRQRAPGSRDPAGAWLPCRYLWRYVDHVPRQNSFASQVEVPPRTEQSDQMSKDLKRRGLTFVGSTICYAFMQAVGMVNDHLVSC